MDSLQLQAFASNALTSKRKELLRKEVKHRGPVMHKQPQKKFRPHYPQQGQAPGFPMIRAYNPFKGPRSGLLPLSSTNNTSLTNSSNSSNPMVMGVFRNGPGTPGAKTQTNRDKPTRNKATSSRPVTWRPGE